MVLHFKTLLPCLFLLYSTASISEEITEQELINLVFEYRAKYQDSTNTLNDLIGYFCQEIQKHHIQHVEEGDRFSDLYVRWALNAPMEFKEISKISEGGCEGIAGVTRCLEIQGIDVRARKNRVERVVLGFVQESSNWVIGGIYVKNEKGGSHSIDYSSETEQ